MCVCVCVSVSIFEGVFVGTWVWLYVHGGLGGWAWPCFTLLAVGPAWLLFSWRTDRRISDWSCVRVGETPVLRAGPCFPTRAQTLASGPFMAKPGLFPLLHRLCSGTPWRLPDRRHLPVATSFRIWRPDPGLLQVWIWLLEGPCHTDQPTI